MYERFRKKLSPTALTLSVIAVVLALAGGAFAAGGALTGKQKKEVKKIAKTFAGKPGPEGPAGPTETFLPPGETQTGVWSYFGNGQEFAYPSISFPLRVDPAPVGPYLVEVGDAQSPQAIAEGCPGTVEDPEADPGHLCVYAQNFVGNALHFLAGTLPADPHSGAVLEFFMEPGEQNAGWGTWAVTAALPSP